jgi:hypothetical protein
MKHIYLQTKQSLLEAAAHNTLLPSENCISFWKEKFLWIIVFKVERLVLFIQTNSAKVMKYIYLSKENPLCYKQQF